MSIGDDNITFSEIWEAVNNGTHVDQEIKLSDFRGLGDIPDSGQISIGTHIKGKTFTTITPLAEVRDYLTDANLTKMKNDLIAAGGTMYDINDDMKYDNTSISDGGSDIYDGGNKLSFNDADSTLLSYKNAITPNGVGDGNYFVKIGQRGTNHSRFFIFVSDLDSSITKVKLKGNLGADGQGSEYKGDFTLTHAGITYRIYWKSVYDGHAGSTGDPPLNHIWILKDVPGSISRSTYGGTQYEDDLVNTGGVIKRIHYIMWCSDDAGDGNTNATEVEALAESFLSIIYFSSHTFTNCGATGKNGPTLANCTSTYSSTSWASNTDYFNMTTQGYQIWTVPMTGTYNIYPSGATGGYSTHGVGGNGRTMRADFNLSKGTKLVIIIGQKGINGAHIAGGGGGGTFVSIENDPLPLIVAGGGGGAGSYQETTTNPSNQDGVNASRENNGTDARPMGPGSWGIAIGSGGTGGNGGTSGESHRPGAGGGGWLTDGTEYTAKHGGGDYGRKGLGYPNGLIGGNNENNGSIYGGFGGGGGGGLGGGGGGGYSGGGGGVWTGYSSEDHGHGGGGGGSYIASSGTSANLNQYLGNSHGNCQITLL
jgi:hypothetical protein